MGKLYCLIGKSGSGKSTIERLLEKKELIRIVSTTTRPMRESEQEGIDYHYINENEFKDLQGNNTLLEETIYNNWHYCIDREYNQLDLENKNYICVIEPHGYERLLNTLGKENVIAIYLIVRDKERVIRSLNREINPDVKEICRRFISDIDLFTNFEEKANYILENINAYETADKIYKIVKSNTIEEKIPIPIDTKVKIIKIISHEFGQYLTDYIGKVGKIQSWIRVHSDNDIIYKVIFDKQTHKTAYFRPCELEILK